jgi:hypothetical protein
VEEDERLGNETIVGPELKLEVGCERGGHVPIFADTKLFDINRAIPEGHHGPVQIQIFRTAVAFVARHLYIRI